ncbi:MAG: DUF1549 domain-containing protein [Gemmataceae bacterium]
MPRWTCALITFALVHSPGQADEFFEKKIRPLLVDRCHACHGPQKQKGGLRLDSVEAFRKGGDSGPTTELIVEAVGYSSGLKMPPTGKLTDAEIADIARWVKDGAKWPGDPTRHSGRSEAPESSRQSVTRAGSPEHWAFRPVTDPPVPAVRDASWPTSPIDRFLLAALEAKGLRPAPPANKRVWLRRVTYDLTGLPPTPAEIEGFLAADSPDACRMVVDRLLASPAYGERWGRHWLDVARYADSNGLDENTGFANAWRYRDYVIAAFNADKPFDRFVVEQLAGDLLRSDDPTPLADRLTATGLLALGPKLLAEVDKEKMVMDIVDEQIDVVSKAFLGLTLSCARCHDHKFDPFPTTDYYALAGIFKSTKTMATLATVAKALERPLDGDDAKAAAVEERRDKLKKKKDERKRVADRVKAAGDDAKPTDRDRLPKLDAEIADLEKNPPPVVAMALSVRDEKQPGPSRVHVRGNHLTLGAEVPRGFPRALVKRRR